MEFIVADLNINYHFSPKIQIDGCVFFSTKNSPSSLDIYEKTLQIVKIHNFIHNYVIPAYLKDEEKTILKQFYNQMLNVVDDRDCKSFSSPIVIYYIMNIIEQKPATLTLNTDITFTKLNEIFYPMLHNIAHVSVCDHDKLLIKSDTLDITYHLTQNVQKIIALFPQLNTPKCGFFCIFISKNNVTFLKQFIVDNKSVQSNFLVQITDTIDMLNFNVENVTFEFPNLYTIILNANTKKINVNINF